jgi:hypothetical protein
MAIKSIYDIEADRMKLVFDAQENAPQVLTLTRRQWLGLLRRLRVVAQQMKLELAAPEPLKAPRARPKRNPDIDALAPVMVDAVHLRAEGDGVRLQFAVGASGRALLLKAPGVKQLAEMVATQAERAGWDPQAAMQRLQAMAMANAAMKTAGAAPKAQ